MRLRTFSGPYEDYGGMAGPDAFASREVAHRLGSRARLVVYYVVILQPFRRTRSQLYLRALGENLRLFQVAFLKVRLSDHRVGFGPLVLFIVAVGEQAKGPRVLIVDKRPPLSRWHPDYKHAFDKFSP